ncbi:MAG: transcriptional regulator [Opitutales bacterium]
MKAYSQDLRDRVLRALERKEYPSAIAKRFEVSRYFVYQVKMRLEEHGERSSRKVGGHRVSQLADLEPTVRKWIEKEPDLTLDELSDRLYRSEGITLKAGAIWHQLNKWGLSFKKNPTRQRARASRRGRGTRKVAAVETGLE